MLFLDANIAINRIKNNELVAKCKDFQLIFSAGNKNIEMGMPYARKTKSLLRIPQSC